MYARSFRATSLACNLQLPEMSGPLVVFERYLVNLRSVVCCVCFACVWCQRLLLFCWFCFFSVEVVVVGALALHQRKPQTETAVFSLLCFRVGFLEVQEVAK